MIYLGKALGKVTSLAGLSVAWRRNKAYFCGENVRGSILKWNKIWMYWTYWITEFTCL